LSADITTARPLVAMRPPLYAKSVSRQAAMTLRALSNTATRQTPIEKTL